MINRLVHPMFLTSLKLGESHESSTEVALDVVLKMLVTTWAKLVCSSSHVGMFWTEKVALVWSEEKIFEHAQVRTAARQAQLALHCYSVQHAASRYYWDWLKQAWTTECLLRGASFLLSALCTPYSGVQTSIFRVGAKQNRNWTGR